MADFAPAIDLSTLDGTNGFRIDGIDAGDRSGASVSSAGDVNGDGFDDIIIGAYRAVFGADYDVGESYVVFGKAGGFGVSFDLASLDGSNGFRLDGIDVRDFSGRSVSSAGDINGDGFNDVIIGAYGGDPAGGATYTGESYVVFGKASGFTATLDLATLDGTNGFRIDGINPDDHSGRSVSSAGDVNGDGIDDLIIGAYGGDSYAGQSFVVFGHTGAFDATLALAALDGSNGFRIDGIDAFDLSGASVSDAGDVNGDGIDDIIVGALGRNGYTGESYVVFGSDSGFAPTLDLATLDGSDGFRIGGIEAGDLSGFPVSSAGDVNGDGFDDIIIGALSGDPGGDSAAGESYVVFGTDQPFAASFDLTSLDGSNGFRIDGVDAGDQAAGATAAGDVNGDGFDDLIIGARYATVGADSYAGETYVVFGKAGGFTPSFDLSTLDGANGFRLDGIDSFDMSGRSVSSAGDFDGDGFDDILIGADFGDPGGDNQAGESYLVYGRKPTTAVERIGAAGDQVIRGGDLNDTLSGLGGADTLNGGQGDDSLLGGLGDDLLRGTAGQDTMTGGDGDDIYFVDSAGDVVIEAAGEGVDIVRARNDFDAGANEIERIVGKGATGLALNAGDNATTIVGTSAGDTIGGGAARDTLRGGGGDDRFETSAGGDYAVGGAGTDSFVLNSAVSGVDRVRIADFVSGTDILEIDADDLGGGLTPGMLDADAFVANASGVAEDAEDRLLYNTTNGVLSFDADGTGAGAAISIARLLGAPTIDAGDFLVTGSLSTIAPFAGIGGARMEGMTIDRWAGYMHDTAPFLSQLP